MSVLVDTSVWIRFLAGRQPYATGLEALLARDEVSGHPLVFGELLIGDRGGRSEFLSSYALIDQATSVPHEEVVEFVRERRLLGRGAGWVDAHLLASAVVDGQKLWTADKSLAALAEELGVAYRPIR